MVQVLVSGVLVGGIYGLIALGLNLIMGVMGIVNFAHGPLLMVGMYISYWLWTVAGLDPYLALPIVAVSLFAMGWLFQRLAIRPLLQTRVGAEELPSLLLTAGLMMFLNNMALILFGPNYKTIHPSYKNNLFQMGMLRINGIRAINFLIALVLTSVFFLVLKYTDIGKKMRATAQDRESATVIGIDTNHIYNIVTATGFALAGIAGGLLLPISYTYPMVGEIFTMKSFIIIVLGGLGNLTGALVGGLAMGVAETVITQHLGAAMTQVFFLMLFVVVILFRPAGLFGKG